MNLRTANKLWFKILGHFVIAFPPFLEDFDTLLPLYRYFDNFMGWSLLSISHTGQ